MHPARSKALLRAAVFACGLFTIAPQWAWGASLSGKWSGTVAVHDAGSGTDVSTPIQAVFDEPQAGSVSGKIGKEGDAETVAIRNGSLSGRQLSFEAVSPETDGPMKFTLVLDGDQLVGQMRGAVDTQEVEGTVKLKRESR